MNTPKHQARIRKWQRSPKGKAHNRAYRLAHPVMYRKAANKYYKNNRKVARARQKKREWVTRIKREYNLTPEVYAALLRAQAFRCAICSRLLKKHKHHFGHIDHSHLTGEVRAILCLQCNAAIGLLGDRIDLCQAAADYLRKYA